LIVAFISPNYFASDWCRREWRAWIDTEIAKHILSAGTAAIYIVEVPGLLGAGQLAEDVVASRVADLCAVKLPGDDFVESVAQVVRELRRRQLNVVQPFYRQGVDAFRREDLHRVLADLAKDLDERVDLARRAALSRSTVPPYNKRFSGRLEELLDLRERLKDDRAGVVCGVHGLGGVGKTELAFTYAHAFASDYPGGRFLVPCEGKESMRAAALCLGDLFREQITEEERETPDGYFAAIAACVHRRLEDLGHILLVLDNVTCATLVSDQETDHLTGLGPKLHLLATTRLPAPPARGWLTLGELPETAALELLGKHRPFDNDSEREAARRIVHRVGGLALAVELVGAWLLVHSGGTYAGIADRLGLESLDQIAGEDEVRLRRHQEKLLGAVLLNPVLPNLTPIERRALDYAALLPADQVPLPWLETLVGRDFPELAESTGLSHAWTDACVMLRRLALFSRSEREASDSRVVRVHRLVQEIIRREMPPDIFNQRQNTLNAFMSERAVSLEKTVHWEEARWELQPIAALANLWADVGFPRASWLLNEAALRWFDLAEWSHSEPLYRRGLAVDEASKGSQHPDVARSLSNLAMLLQATNRLADAEPLFRRALAIDEASYGSEHANVAIRLNNLALLLRTTNRLTEAERLQRRALTIFETSYGPEHPLVARGLNNLAMLLQMTNRVAQAEPLYRRALAICEKSYGSGHPNVANNLNNLAHLLQTTNRLAEAEPLYRRALAIDEASFGPNHPEVAMMLANLATLLQATNRRAEAEPLYRRALAIFEASYGPEHPNVAVGLGILAMLLQATNRLAEAEPLYRRALAIDEASYGPEHPNVATILNNLAELLRATNRLADAETHYRRALAINEVSYGPEHPDLAAMLSNLALLLQATNRLAEAETLHRRALAISEASYGPEHPDVAVRANNLGMSLQETNRMAEAETLYRRALAVSEASYGPEHPNLARILVNLALLLQHTNRMAEAESLYRRALAIDEASYGPEHPDVAQDLSNLATLFQVTNRFAEAETLYRRALAIAEASYGPEHPLVANVLNNLAHLLYDTNRVAEAEPLFRRALAIVEASYGPEHPLVANVLNELARLLHDTNRVAEAEPLFRRALAIAEASDGPEHPQVANVLNQLARLLQDTNRVAKAEPLYRRALAIAEASYGPEHPSVALIRDNLASLH
jgi:tetratricopeptide (TPR) repeat protein